MSALGDALAPENPQWGQKRRSGDVRVPSALPLKADILRKRRHISKVPQPDSCVAAGELYSITSSA
jgi:hypothetical protein